MRMRPMRMKFKRLCAFFLLVFVITSSYMYYTLFFNPQPNSSRLQDIVIQQEKKVPVHEKDKSGGEDDSKEKLGLMKLFPHGVQKLWKGGKEADEKEPGREESDGEEINDEEPKWAHKHDAEKKNHRESLKDIMIKQQKLIDKQAELLKRLENQDHDAAPHQALPMKPDHPQDNHAAPLFDGLKNVHKESHEDPINHAGMNAQEDTRRGEGDQVMKLEVNGIQPRRKIDLSKYIDKKEDENPEHVEGQDALQMFEKVHQRGQDNIKQHPLVPPEQEEAQGDVDGAEGKFHESIRNNPNAGRGHGALHMFERARQEGHGNRKQQPFAPLEPLGAQDDGDSAERRFHKSIRNNRNGRPRAQAGNGMFHDSFHNNHRGRPPADRNRKLGESGRNKIFDAANVGAMDAQRMFHDSVRNNRFQNDEDEHQLPNNGHFRHQNQHQFGNPNRPRRGARGRRIASLETDNAIQSQNNRLEEHDDSKLLAERFKKDPNSVRNVQQGLRPNEVGQQQKPGLDEALKLLKLLGGTNRFQVEVKDLSVPVNDTVKCVPLQMEVLSRHICVYPYHVDTKMSRQLGQTGTFHEEQELKEFEAALSTNDSLAAVDIGAALGIYSLLAADKNRQVLAVEPMRDHQRLFAKTMQINSFTNQVTLVANALGEQKQYGLIRSPHPTGNMGAVYVDPVTDLTKVGSDVSKLVHILQLDDLLPVVKFTSAVMKLDAQGDDELVLRGARKFFDKIDVRYVLMHWLPTFTRDHLNECLQFLTQRGYVPTDSVSSNKTLSPLDLQKDINFVVWRKNRP